MSSRLETRYRGLLIIATPLDVTKPGKQVYFQVFHNNALLFSLVHGVTFIAAHMRFQGRENAGQIAYDLGLHRVHGMIDLEAYRLGQEEECWIQMEPQQFQDVPDEEVQKRLLEALKAARRLNSAHYKNEPLDVEGFCMVLGVSQEKFLYNAEVIAERGLIREFSQPDQADVSNGSVYITVEGLDFLAHQERRQPSVPAQGTSWMPSDADLQSLIKKWGQATYHDSPIEIARVRTWLSQFPDGRPRQLMYKLVQGIDFFNELRVRQALYAIHGQIMEELGFGADVTAPPGTILLSGFGEITDSGPLYARIFGSRNSIRDRFVAPPAGILGKLDKFPNVQAIVFTDDVIGSGGTYAESLNNLPDMLVQRLVDRKIRVFVTAVCGLDSGVDFVEQALSDKPFEKRTVVYRQLGESDRCFSPEAHIFDNEEERAEAEGIAAETAENILPRSLKDWKLGYGGAQLLLVFPDNCPNNTLPIFWWTPQDDSWIPLFPRSIK